MSRRLSIGIDTSNYKTSVAAVDERGNILCNLQRYLQVRKGERGLRQSVALFQHVNNLPELIESCMASLGDGRIDCVCASSRPRPVAGSYMPVFNAGVSAARMLAAALKVPYRQFSHQEGHIEAVRFFSPLKEADRFLSFHFSGGTTEALLVDGEEISLAGGTKDISFGQLLDRVGVTLGMAFPCGGEMDEIALRGGTEEIDNILPRIKCSDGFINLSGIETKCQRLAAETEQTQLIRMLFFRIAEAVCTMTEQMTEKFGVRSVLFEGGVSSSRFLRCYAEDRLNKLEYYFGEPALSTDNAVGVALLGGKQSWR